MVDAWPDHPQRQNFAKIAGNAPLTYFPRRASELIGVEVAQGQWPWTKRTFQKYRDLLESGNIKPYVYPQLGSVSFYLLATICRIMAFPNVGGPTKSRNIDGNGKGGCCFTSTGVQQHRTSDNGKCRDKITILCIREWFIQQSIQPRPTRSPNWLPKLPNKRAVSHGKRDARFVL
jgi:hypothetical protein